MPYTGKQRRAACADYGRGKKGEQPRVMKGATLSQLREMCTGPMKKPKKAPKR